MPQQKIPLFGGLIKACHDGIAAAVALNPVFTPPDKTLAPGTQAYYALHLWLKPATINPGVTNEFFILQAYRGSVAADKRAIWAGEAADLRQVFGPSTALQQANAFDGVSVKILDGYVVRGDVFVELTTSGALADKFADADGTKIWGYYQRIGETDEGFRFIGEPPAGPAFDTGLSVTLAPGETKTIHTFETDRIDEIWLEVAVRNDGGEAPLTGATVIILADDNDNPISQVALKLPTTVLGAPNTIRDPQSVYDFYGVFGNNPNLASLRVANTDNATSVSVHGRFARH